MKVLLSVYLHCYSKPCLFMSDVIPMPVLCNCLEPIFQLSIRYLETMWSVFEAYADTVSKQLFKFWNKHIQNHIVFLIYYVKAPFD